MSCGCANTDKNNGQSVVDLVRSKGKNDFPLRNTLEIECVECKNTFTMKTHVDKSPHCNMVYGVTPCSSHDKNNVKSAGINY